MTLELHIAYCIFTYQKFSLQQCWFPQCSFSAVRNEVLLESMRTLKHPQWASAWKNSEAEYTSRSPSITALILNPPYKAWKARFLASKFFHALVSLSSCFQLDSDHNSTLSLLFYYHFLFRPPLPSLIQPVKLDWIRIIIRVSNILSEKSSKKRGRISALGEISTFKKSRFNNRSCKCCNYRKQTFAK